MGRLPIAASGLRAIAVGFQVGAAFEVSRWAPNEGHSLIQEGKSHG